MNAQENVRVVIRRMTIVDVVPSSEGMLVDLTHTHKHTHTRARVQFYGVYNMIRARVHAVSVEFSSCSERTCAAMSS